MKTYTVAALVLLLGTFFLTSAFAEMIVLKSGQTVEGKIVEKTDKYVKVEFEGVTLTYFANEIKSIDEGPSSAAAGQQALPAPESAPVTENPKENLSVIARINNSYYNPMGQGVKHFTCEVTSSVFDETKKKYSLQSSPADLENKVINSIKFHLAFPKDFQFEFTFVPFTSTGNAQFDTDLQQAIDDTRVLAIDFSKWVWSTCVIPMLVKPESECTIDKLPEGYRVSFQTEEGSFKLFADAKFIPTHAIITDDYGTTNQAFYFMSTSQVPLLQRYEHNSNNGEEKYSATLEYQEAQGFQMLKHAVVQKTKSGTTQNFELSFSNFEINK